MTITRPGERFAGLPPRSSRCGYIYIIAFSTAETTVKVGSTADPRSRFTSHQAAGEPFGVDITDWWLSPEHLEYVNSERQLVRLVEGLGGRKVRNEYFTGIAFAEVVALAESMAITEVSPIDWQLAACRERAESRRRAEQHSADEQLNVQVGLRYTAEHYGLTQQQVADIVERDRAGEVARMYDALVDSARQTRLAWRRGRRRSAA